MYQPVGLAATASAAIDWIGGEFDPNHFDLEEINRRLLGIKRKLRRSQTRAKKRSP